MVAKRRRRAPAYAWSVVGHLNRDSGPSAPASASGVAVIVCTRDRPALLEQALSCLVEGLRSEDQLVVVDSASRDPGVRRIAESFTSSVVRCQVPGASRARNAGIAASGLPLLAFTDDDCLAAPDWTSVVSARLGTDSSLGFVSGRIEADRAVGVPLSVLTAGVSRAITSPREIDDIGHGANMAFRRAALEDIGGFDELLGAGGRFPGAEDADAFWRVLRAGWRGLYEPQSVVTHVQWRSKADKLRVQYRYGKGDGAFVAKARALDAQEWRPWLHRSVGPRIAGQVLRSIGRRRVGDAAVDVVRAAGFVSGFVAGSRVPVKAGRFELTRSSENR